MKLKRQKQRNLLLSLVYRLSRLLRALPAETRLRFYLDLEWIFDRLALEESFRVFTPETHPFRSHSMAFLLGHIHQDDRVLDIGSNRGEMSALLAKHCKEVIGIEVEETLVREAAGRYPAANLHFVHTEGREYLEREDTVFDVILLSHVIEHLDAPADLLELVRRRARHVYIEVPDFERNYLNQYRLACGSQLIYADEDHVWEFDRNEVRTLIAASGLEILEEDCRFGVVRVWCRGQA